MNNLEFIEKEIHFISVVKKEYEKMLNDERPENQKGYLKTLIKEYGDKLQTLQQIKTELEAWEVVKKHLEYFPDDYWNGITEEIITMTSQIDKKDYPTIKKALEVQNDR